MRARTERLLYFLLWGADMLMRPTFRNVTDSFEQWAYRNGLLNDLHELERREFLERKRSATGATRDRIYRLTEVGRLQALGGRDPEKQWNRRWDGQWRLVLFDIPQEEHVARMRLTRFLRTHAFGNLQKSVWVTPDPVGELLKTAGRAKDEVSCLLTLDARPAAGESDSAIVKRAWNFERINERYEACLKLLKARPTKAPQTPDEQQRLLQWAQAENAAWLQAVSADPLLPEMLLPADYLGRRVWEMRQHALADAGKLLPE